jgi:hypothetical protein
METKTYQGIFDAIDSFAIQARSEFYIIGELTEGTMQSGWFANIALNRSLAVTLRIKTIEQVDFTHERARYKLIVIDCKEDEDTIDLLLSLNIGNETVKITIEGED